MTTDSIARKSKIFIDANIFIYHFLDTPLYGAACTELVQRVLDEDYLGVTSVHVVSEVVHRLSTIEACAMFSWPYKGIAKRMESHPENISRLEQYRSSLESLLDFGIEILANESQHLLPATDAMREYGLLYNDALSVALMKAAGISVIASFDTDFDRVAVIQRLEPMVST
ncbi:MAG: type II toxin-antitoxin system VapC family toxin [Pirellulales bacterium]